MPAGKEYDKHGNYKKPPNKGFSTASWDERIADNEEENDGDITDPELIAEKEYALEHGNEFNMNLASGDGLGVAVGNRAGPKSYDKTKKDALISARIKQAKADRKARGRGVSGSMCRKDKDITCGGFHTLMDMDVYYGIDDEYGSYASDTESFNSRANGFEFNFDQGNEEAVQSEVDYVDDNMNRMSLNDNDEEENDDGPGPSRSYGAGDHGKEKRLYRM